MRSATRLVFLTLLAACGGGSGTPSSPSPGPEPTISITPSGVNPATITVSQGTRVLFVNNDTRPHNIASDPHPEHTDCPDINQVGLLQSGQSRETGNMNTVRTCGYHDHDDPPPGGNKWTGKIVIQ